MKVGFLVSGALGETVLKYFLNQLDIQFVLTDKSSTSIVDLCKLNNIPVYAGNPRNENIHNFIQGLECDVIASVNYLFIIQKKIISLAKGLCFNVHGSLLPKFRGRTPHVWAIINGEKQTGITAHVIDEGCDTGAIIKQVVIDIEKEDTGAIILEKYKALYIPLVEEVFKNYKEGNIQLEVQDESKATFFGKRTQNDGRIDWNWCVERIQNWVRAQAYPYPGAFTFYNNQKIVIDKVSKSDFGFHYLVENGTILSANPILVKCTNSVLQIDVLRENGMKFRINDKFY